MSKIYIVMLERKDPKGRPIYPEHWELEIAFDNDTAAERYIDNKKSFDQTKRFIKELELL